MTKRRVWRAGLALAVIGILALILASFFRNNSSSTHPAYVVLGDVSGDSTDGTRHRAEAILREVAVQARKQQGYVAATAFQDHAQAKVHWRFAKFVLPDRYKHNSTGAKRYLDKESRDFKNSTKDIFEHPEKVDGTDIIGALLAADLEFQRMPKATSKFIILASNMANVDESPKGVNLKKHPLTSAQIDAKLGSLEKMDQIAPLKGVCVFVIGPGQIPDEPIKRGVQITIARFWDEYFGRSKGTLAAWTYGLSWPLGCKRVRPLA